MHCNFSPNFQLPNADSDQSRSQFNFWNTYTRAIPSTVDEGIQKIASLNGTFEYRYNFH